AVGARRPLFGAARRELVDLVEVNDADLRACPDLVLRAAGLRSTDEFHRERRGVIALPAGRSDRGRGVRVERNAQRAGDHLHEVRLPGPGRSEEDQVRLLDADWAVV